MYKIEKIKELVEQLNRASDVYYNTEYIIMEDKEFDKLLDELKNLEDETNFRLANSPTQNVGAKVLTELNEVEHNHPMLSLDKCHSVEEVIKFANGKDLVASIKLDGLTVSILYQDGELVRAETRGNGYVGSDITEHIKQFQNVPLKINKEGIYVVDGEALITDDEFSEINKNGEYKNSRNLASGTLSVLDTSLVVKRKLRFFVWDVIEGGDWNDIKMNLHEASLFGFDVVPNWYVGELQNDKVEIMINDIFDVAKAYGLPCDGIVFKFEDIEYGKSLGATGHHFRNGIAYKAKDEVYETKLLDIEWTVGRTGTITPTAVFDPIEIDGTMVERASVHNVSVMEEILGTPYIGQKIQVYKANCIIPCILSGEKI